MVAERSFSNNPFERLRDRAGTTPDHSAHSAHPSQEPDHEGLADAPPSPPQERAAEGTRRLPRAVIRMERSGRGGKEVTIVSHLPLSPDERATWLKALKHALGCGGTVEGETLVLQGDQRKRLPALLSARGVRTVGTPGTPGTPGTRTKNVGR